MLGRLRGEPPEELDIQSFIQEGIFRYYDYTREREREREKDCVCDLQDLFLGIMIFAVRRNDKTT